MIRGHDNLRRVRKALLSDLSALVKIAKRLQDVANGQLSDEGVDNLLDEMLLKAFKIVTRAVVFLDIWIEESKPSNTLTVSSAFEAAAAAANAPLTPPADGSVVSSTARRPSTVQSDISMDDSRSVTSATRSSARLSRSIRNSLSQSSDGPPQVDRMSRTPSEGTSRTSMSRRVSYHGGSIAVQDFSLVSTHLGRCYDAFLSVLGSFIGLHMQQRSSTELLITTQQAVKSCRRLMTIIEAVMKRDSRRPEVIRKAKDHLVDKIMDLARAAQHAFRTAANEEVVLTPADHQRLVDAATACVRSAGECYAHTQLVLEQIGDFEYEATDPFHKEEAASATSTDQEGLHSIAEESTSRQSPPRPIAPKLVIPQNDPQPSSPFMNVFSPESRLSSEFTPSTEITVDTPATDVSNDDDIPPTPPPKTDMNIGHSGFGVEVRDFTTPKAPKNEARAVTSTGSTSTFASSTKDSDWSGHSVTSTSATSVDHETKKDVIIEEEMSARQIASAVEEIEETEEKLLETTFAHELSTKDGRIIGGTLRGLIERLTAFDSTPDSEFVSTFYLTFRLFATPLEFAEALADRFNYIGQSPTIANPVRLRVYNSLKGWLEAHWRHDCDTVALPFIMDFTKSSLIPVLPTAGKRLLELAEKVSVVHGPVVPRLISSIGKTNTAIAQYINPDTPLPQPIISKNQLSLLRSWKENGAPVNITDFDPLELARQFTIKESQIFCSILPEELLATEWTKQSGSLAVNVRMKSTLSTDLASLVADSILQLEDAKKRAAVIKQWVKIANKCLELNNYDSLMAIYCALTNSTITRMKRTWEVVSPKTRALLDTLGAIVDVSKNYTGLRQRLQSLMPPCLPFVGMYLTDLTFVDHGNPPTRQLSAGDSSFSVINFDKHVKTAKIISDLQRFQIPYRLTEIPELQTWMQDQLVRVRSTGDKSFQNFYRRSLVLEPRDIPARRTSPVPGLPQGPQNKEKFDFLSWTHSSKDKAISTH